MFPKYHDVEIFKIFDRVYTEHFTVVEKKIELVDATKLTTNTLQSPDDIEATYVQKKKIGYRGSAVSVTETCNPENKLNLITDISVTPNNVDDSKILNKRLDIIKESTLKRSFLHFSMPNPAQIRRLFSEKWLFRVDSLKKKHQTSPNCIPTAAMGQALMMKNVLRWESCKSRRRFAEKKLRLK